MEGWSKGATGILVRRASYLAKSKVGIFIPGRNSLPLEEGEVAKRMEGITDFGPPCSGGHICLLPGLTSMVV